jgi:hypothetical protein
VNEAVGRQEVIRQWIRQIMRQRRAKFSTSSFELPSENASFEAFSWAKCDSPNGGI